jgi:pSer/pThr/pTyr-binding forkhead associated (FHA) protein
MGEGGEDRDSLWVDGRFTVRLRGIGAEPGRIIRLRRPFALVGQIPGADIRIDDPGVDGRHVLLILDRRGVFGVDLRSRTGTRFAGAAGESAWLGAGDILEVAGRRIELLQFVIDGATVNPPLCDDDPLGDAEGLVDVALEPLDAPGPPWMLGSALAFVGRGDACAIRIENASASRTHTALFRTATAAYLIDLLGRRTVVDDHPVDGATKLLDGDVLTVGQARFAVRIDKPSDFFDNDQKTLSDSHVLVTRNENVGIAINDPRAALVAMLVEASGGGPGARSLEILDVLRQFQADTATLLEAQLEKIETMNREIAALRDEVRGPNGAPPPPAEPLRLDLITPTPAPVSEPSGWLLDRLHALESESKSTWKDVLGRVTSALGASSPPSPGRSLAPTRPASPLGPRS